MKPSPGTIYTALKILKENFLIKKNKEGKIITYIITTEGENVLKIAKQQFCKTFKDVL